MIQLGLIFCTMALMWINASVGAWPGNLFVLALIGGWALSQYDSGRHKTKTEDPI